MSEPFRVRYPLRFAHCDPAGIAYYPRYFELCDAAIEDWCAAVLQTPRSVMHLELGLGMPTVELNASFAAPSRLGDLLDIELTVAKLGNSSVELQAGVSCQGVPRFRVRYVQVLVRLADMGATPWPQAWRARLAVGHPASAG